MDMKNICGKIPLDLHAKVRQEIEQRDISTQEFLQQVIEEHFMEKGVDSMAARTIAVQVTEELFGRLKAAVAWKGCKQKDFLISIIENAIAQVEAEQRQAQMAETEQVPDGEPYAEEAAEETAEEAEDEPAGESDAIAEDGATEEASGEPEDETAGAAEEGADGTVEETGAEPEPQTEEADSSEPAESSVA